MASDFALTGTSASPEAERWARRVAGQRALARILRLVTDAPPTVEEAVYALAFELDQLQRRVAELERAKSRRPRAHREGDDNVR